jgi:multidrug resistance efflux pump
MPRQRTRSDTLETAETRAAAIGTVGDVRPLGGDLSVATYNAAIDGTRAKLSRYNALLSEAEIARREFDAAEHELADLNDRMLAAVGAVYGRNSQSYAKAGGTLKSERNSGSRKKTPTVTSTAGVN